MPVFYSHKSERRLLSEYEYAPTLGFVPELSLPDNLPELGHFATFENDASVDWTKQQMTSIAPSFAISMLPDLNDLAGSTSTTVPQPVPTTVVAPPPPPPPADLPAIIPLTTPAPPPAPPAPTPSLAPPPPPPPGPSAVDDSVLGIPPIEKNPDDDDDDGGNPLLAQIRQFSKAKLKSAATKPSPGDDAPLPPAGEQKDIMAALKERLGKRRGFITGENTDSTPSKSAVEARAPSPPPQTGGAFTDAIAAKAKEVAELQQRRKDDDDDSNSAGDDDWD